MSIAWVFAVGAVASAISSPIVPSILCVARFLSGARFPAGSILIVVCTMHKVRHGLSCTTPIERQPLEMTERRRHCLGRLWERHETLDHRFRKPGAQQ
jgi:hypothetical protein